MISYTPGNAFPYQNWQQTYLVGVQNLYIKDNSKYIFHQDKMILAIFLADFKSTQNMIVPTAGKIGNMSTFWLITRKDVESVQGIDKVWLV